MKNGKLFGLINVVDLIVIVIVLAVIAVLGAAILGDTATDVVSVKVPCNAEVIIYGVTPEVADEAVRQELVGERLVSGNEYMDANITSLDIRDNAQDAYFKDIIVGITTQVAPETASPKIGSQELRAGKEYIVKTQTFECTGIIDRVDIVK